jgi:hypothetical protein
MNACTKLRLGGVAGLVVVVGLPLAAYLMRGNANGGCALDGAKINTAYRVQIVDGHGDSHAFCCLRCAQLWLKRQSAPPQSVVVADESSGEEIDAQEAVYVRSSVVTTPATGNRIHAFRSRADAEKHADRFGGTVLSESETPLYMGAH